jgi:hypothetical protein
VQPRRRQATKADLGPRYGRSNDVEDPGHRRRDIGAIGGKDTVGLAVSGHSQRQSHDRRWGRDNGRLQFGHRRSPWAGSDYRIVSVTKTRRTVEQWQIDTMADKSYCVNVLNLVINKKIKERFRRKIRGGQQMPFSLSMRFFRRSHPVGIHIKTAIIATALASGAVLGTAAPANAGLAYIGGVSSTVYGVSPYGGAPQVAPSFIFNNVTGFNDILASPGGGFLTAAPTVPNNILQTGIVGVPFYSFQVGGGNGNGPFGAGQTLVSGVRTAFALSDAALCCSASYIVSSWTSNLLVTPGGWAGDLGTFLSIAGSLPAPTSAVAVSLISHYYINDVYQGTTTPLILAMARNGNFQATGDVGAAIVMDGFGQYRGLAVNSLPSFLPVAGNVVKVVSTLTAIADPSSVSASTPDLSLLPGVTLPTALAQVSGAVPEPASWAMLITGFGLVGAIARRRRHAALPMAGSAVG